MLLVVHYCYRFLCTVVTIFCTRLLPFSVHSLYHFLSTRGFCLQLLGEVEKSLPGNFASINDAVYVEPFVGGGAVLFWILQKYSNISQAVINDINPELINVYRIIKDAPQDLISVLRQYHDS